MSAFDKIKELIENQKSFVLEAGAGSGKTFTLIQTINFILETKGASLKYDNKTIVCITYTNVAKNEIIERLENNPLVIVLTIHEFLWSSINNFQNQLLIELDLLNDKMQAEKPEKYQLGLLERNDIKEVVYNDTGYRDFENGLLHHDDVISLSAAMLKKYSLLTKILAEKYPYIFIDEYQDTAPETIDAFINYLLDQHKNETLLGFFGDSHQKIYDGGIGDLDWYTTNKKLVFVPKEENYRSSINVISLLNNVRRNIQQISPPDKKMMPGSVKFINCDNYPAKLPKGKITDYEREILPQKNTNYDQVVDYLSQNGWDFGSNSKDKVLIIANSRVAERGKFGNLYRIFSSRYGEGANDQLMKRENVIVRFFLGSLDKKTSKERKNGVEHLISFWKDDDFGNVVSFLNGYGRSSETQSNYLTLRTHADKVRINSKLSELSKLRQTSSVKQVFEFVNDHGIMNTPDGLFKHLKKLEVSLDEIEDTEIRDRLQRDKVLLDAVMELPYLEFINLFKHSQKQTVFTTKHGTKGDQYRNVLVVIDDTSWKQKYNFQNFIDGSEENDERKLRTKNLFYVSCSRAIENLVVLSLSTMDKNALSVVNSWFGLNNTFSISNLNIE